MLSKQLADYLKHWEQAPNVAAAEKNKIAFNTETLPSVSWEVNEILSLSITQFNTLLWQNAVLPNREDFISQVMSSLYLNRMTGFLRYP